MQFTSSDGSVRKFGFKRDPKYRELPIRKLSQHKRRLLPLVSPDLLASTHIPVTDQDVIGCCTAEGSCKAFTFAEFQQNFVNPRPQSVLGFYYNEQLQDGNDPKQDNGSTITTASKVLLTKGTASDDSFPFKKENYYTRPSDQYFTEAAKQKGSMVPVNWVEADLMDALCNGKLVVVGFDVFDSFMSKAVADTGVVPTPAPTDNFVGGHCMVLCQLNSMTKQGLFCNSWGVNWGCNNSAGQRGYCTIPYDYMFGVNTQTNQPFFSDSWIVSSLHNPDPTPAPAPAPAPTPVPVPIVPNPPPNAHVVLPLDVKMFLAQATALSNKYKF